MPPLASLILLVKLKYPVSVGAWSQLGMAHRALHAGIPHSHTSFTTGTSTYPGPLTGLTSLNSQGERE